MATQRLSGRPGRPGSGPAAADARPWPRAALQGSSAQRVPPVPHPPTHPPLPPCRRREGGAKRARGEGGADSDDDLGDDPDAPGRQQQTAAAEPADGAAPMDADEPISDAEEEPAVPAVGAVGADAAEAIRRAVDEVGQGAAGAACSVTGVKAVLAAKGVHVSSGEITEGGPWAGSREGGGPLRPASCAGVLGSDAAWERELSWRCARGTWELHGDCSTMHPPGTAASLPPHRAPRAPSPHCSAEAAGGGWPHHDGWRRVLGQLLIAPPASLGRARRAGQHGARLMAAVAAAWRAVCNVLAAVYLCNPRAWPRLRLAIRYCSPPKRGCAAEQAAGHLCRACSPPVTDCLHSLVLYCHI